MCDTRTAQRALFAVEYLALGAERLSVPRLDLLHLQGLVVVQAQRPAEPRVGVNTGAEETQGGQK